MTDSGAAESDWFGDVLFDKGWCRTLPANFIALLAILVAKAPLTREELDAELGRIRPSETLSSSAWPELEPWTDEQHRQSNDEWGSSEEGSTTASELNAEEAADRAKDMATLTRYFTAKGVADDHTFGGLLDLLVACEVVLLDARGYYWPNVNAPLPGEVLPLDEEEAAIQDRMRWTQLHAEYSQAIIRLFQPNYERLDHLSTTLSQLGKQLDADPETVRSAIEELLREGDFSASKDISRLGVDQPFLLRVDWRRFATSRISVSSASPDE